MRLESDMETIYAPPGIPKVECEDGKDIEFYVNPYPLTDSIKQQANKILEGINHMSTNTNPPDDFIALSYSGYLYNRLEKEEIDKN